VNINNIIRQTILCVNYATAGEGNGKENEKEMMHFVIALSNVSMSTLLY